MDFITSTGPASARAQQRTNGRGPQGNPPASGALPARMTLPRVGDGVPPTLLPSMTSQMDQLGETDPALMRQYIALVMLLKKDPDKLEAFVKQLQREMQSTSQSAPRAQAWSIEIEVSTTQLTTWLSSGDGATQVGARVAQETVRLRVTVQNGGFQVQPANAPGKDPLTLDLNENGAFDMDNRGRFDVDGDGRLDTTPLPSGGDAFLALDVNGNGRIDDGHELFGDQNGAAHGFSELGKYDDNHDAVIDARDAVFERLQVLGDFDADGQMEHKSLVETGVQAISVKSDAVARQVTPDVALTQLGTYTRDGRERLAGVLLVKYV